MIHPRSVDVDVDAPDRSRRDFIATWVFGVGVLATGAGSSQAASSGSGHAPPPRILVVGDSLSAEYGLPRGSGWVALLEARLARDKMAATVVNASISGDTTSGGRSRLSALLAQHHPTHVVIELGGNDVLRGLPLKMSEDNLGAMVRAVKAAGAKAMLIGMQAPPNYGSAYVHDFEALFPRVAKAQGAALTPFLLEGVANDAADPLRWFQPDRIHPIASAHPRILDNVWSVMKPWLAAL